MRTRFLKKDMDENPTEVGQAFCELIDERLINDASGMLEKLMDKWRGEGVDPPSAMANLLIAVAKQADLQKVPGEVFPMLCATAWATAKHVTWRSDEVHDADGKDKAGEGTG